MPWGCHFCSSFRVFAVYIAMLAWFITFSAMLLKLGKFCLAYGRTKDFACDASTLGRGDHSWADLFALAHAETLFLPILLNSEQAAAGRHAE